MKREHAKQETFIDWLKSVGCLIYLPLSQGDLQDKITGNYITLSGNGSLVWDANVQMYLCKTPSSTYQYVGSILFPYNYSDFAENQFTRCWTFKRKSTTGQFCNISGKSNTPDALTTGGNAGWSLVLQNWSDNIDKMLCIEGSPRLGYFNEVQTSTGSVYTPNLPSNWANNTSTIYIGLSCGSNYVAKEAYMQDIIIFNRRLTSDEIAKLYEFI